MYNASKVGSTIAELRLENGLKQNKLSSILSMSPSNLSNYERGLYWPALDTLCKIADLFQVTTDYLLGRTTYRCPPEVFREYVSSHHKVHHVINILLELDAVSLDAVVHYAEYLRDTAQAKQDRTPKSRMSCPETTLQKVCFFLRLFSD